MIVSWKGYLANGVPAVVELDGAGLFQRVVQHVERVLLRDARGATESERGTKFSGGLDDWQTKAAQQKDSATARRS
jgi:hypothetical protein